jgi:hypothetical protein
MPARLPAGSRWSSLEDPRQYGLPVISLANIHAKCGSPVSLLTFFAFHLAIFSRKKFPGSRATFRALLNCF